MSGEMTGGIRSMSINIKMVECTLFARPIVGDVSVAFATYVFVATPVFAFGLVILDTVIANSG